MKQSKSKSVTILDVARLAGVSQATVSRYINQAVPVSDDVASRVEAAIQELRFIPHSAARSLATSKTHTIGLLLQEISGDFFTPLLSGIDSESSQAGYDLLVSTHKRHESRKTNPLGLHNTDGILVYSGSLDKDAIASFYQAGIPMVLIHHSPPDGIPLPCVTIENKAATKKIVDHLIDVHQRRRIVLLKGPENEEDSFWRESGYREALQTHGLPVDETLLLKGDFNRKIAEAEVRRLAASGIAFDAVFTGDDEAAIGALAALKEAGLRVPEDVAVVGFDDQLFAAFLSPGLTTVRAPTEEVGRTAVRQLIALIEGRQVSPLTLLPTEIIIRHSCGCRLS